MQLFCAPCEIVDHWRVWIIYLTGAGFGSAAYYIVCPNGHLVGASAAVFALLSINMAELIMVRAFMHCYSFFLLYCFF